MAHWVVCEMCGMGYSVILREPGDACGDCSSLRHVREPDYPPCSGIVREVGRRPVPFKIPWETRH